LWGYHRARLTLFQFNLHPGPCLLSSSPSACHGAWPRVDAQSLARSYPGTGRYPAVIVDGNVTTPRLYFRTVRESRVGCRRVTLWALFQQLPSKLLVSLSISSSSPVIYTVTLRREGRSRWISSWHFRQVTSVFLQSLPAAFSDDSPYGFGVPHFAYLTSLVVRLPVLLLRHVAGSPDLRLLRGLRHLRARAP
jgi:hypothetical protein